MNRYLNTIDPALHSWRWEENECSLHYDRRWELRQWELEPRFTRCPYLDTLIARYVEIAAERLPSVDVETCVRSSRALLDDVRAEDWYAMKPDAAIMTRGDYILGHDLTRTGTLFKLWNAMRLDLSLESVAALLKYLDTLLTRDDREFEERKYYEDLFLRLYDPRWHREFAEFAAHIKHKRETMARRHVTLLIQGRQTFNFVRAGDRIVAVAQALGPVELFKDRVGERDLPPVLFTGATMAEVAAKVARVDAGVKVIDVYNGFDVLSDGDLICAMRQPELNGGGRHEDEIISAHSIEELRRKIDVTAAPPVREARALLARAKAFARRLNPFRP